ncbi:hypothetical protein K469DRAFT_663168 [Zopfia rhizophila CBS 207.26]|uniref:BTB domain-containing protein n=1 Tax=Zopfia rhizophila CBS 207.26 TaxID=1314779 RepID=A0A6A6E5B9_9PEZI|nr:hypothetical protein K469DRAFT_663168 [Zopfia rhizophila CBS 207.26]
MSDSETAEPTDGNPPAQEAREVGKKNLVERINTDFSGLEIDEKVHPAECFPELPRSSSGNTESEPVDETSSSDDTTKPPTPVEELTTIDPRGDIQFVVTYQEGLESRTFLVLSTCIRLASMKWAALLDALSPPTSDQKLRLEIEEQHVKAIEYILRASHLQHDEVPNNVTFENLVEVAETCNRHAVIQALRPYLRMWSYPWLSKLKEPGYELWLVVAYEFGYHDIFAHLSEEVAMNMRLTTSGEYLMPYGVNLSTSKLPGFILKNLIRFRQEHLEDIIECCYEFIDYYSGKEPECNNKSHRNECTAMALGSFLKGLKDCGVWPQRPKPEDIKSSVNQFRNDLNQIEILRYPGHVDTDCTPWLFTAYLYHSGRHVEIISKASECSGRFGKLSNRDWRTAPLAWEYASTIKWDFLERDFQEHDSDSDSDDDFEPEESINEPAEEYLDSDEASGYDSGEDNSDEA